MSASSSCGVHLALLCSAELAGQMMAYQPTWAWVLELQLVSWHDSEL